MQQVKFAQKSALNKIADFSVELLKNTMTSRKNIIISPVSLLAVLAMAMRGAKGDTLRKIENVIGTDAETLSGYLARFFAGDADTSEQRTHERENVVKTEDKINSSSPLFGLIQSFREGKIKPIPMPGASSEEEPADVPSPLKFANSIWVK